MPNYRRAWIPGGSWFFTVTLRDRHARPLLIERIEALRAAFAEAVRTRPFRIDAIVVLPDHLHAIWTLPPGDADFATRWRLIKTRFSQAVEATERRSTRQTIKGERGIWQRRYWEHAIRDEDDLRTHRDYVHYNPVKHGLVNRVADWPFSSFHRHVDAGLLPKEWGSGVLDRPRDP